MALRALPLLLLLGCAAEASDDVRQARAAKVVGASELTPVAGDGSNLAARYRPTLDAFGLLEFDEGRNHCTVTHVGGGIVLTAGHCFDAGATRAGDVACPAGYALEWGLRVDRAAYLTSSCERILAMQHTGDIDYAILRVSPVPAAAVRPDLASRPAMGTSITVFSYPSHRPLEWSQTCKVEAVPSADGGAAGANEFLHECDTQPASSGATVLDDATLAVVGIHDGAWKGVNYATYLADTPLAEFLGPIAAH